MHRPSLGAQKEADSAWMRLVLLMGFVWNFGNENKNFESDFGRLLVELESHIPLNLFENDWPMQRPQWLQACRLATDSKAFGLLLANMGGYIAQENFVDAWAEVNEKWFNDCSENAAWSQLTEQILELENGIYWEKIESDWEYKKLSWREEVMHFNSLNN